MQSEQYETMKEMDAPGESEQPLNLLYPFYLDADMSMAFAAALTGGVSLEEEHVERIGGASQAVKNLHGNLRLWRVGSIGAGAERTESSDALNEARLVRRHTEASIFIDLYNELRRTEKLREDPAFDGLTEGSFVSMQMGPAIAPLRRVVDQIVRLLDVMAPIIEPEESESMPRPGGKGRSAQQRAAQEAARHAVSAEQEEGLRSLRQLRRLFIALQEDLAHSGMVDIVVDRENEPTVILTLDKRFIGPTTLELLHSSKFTVVGKVTQVWREEDDVVPLYRRSVLSLLPALGGAMAYNILMLLGMIAKTIDMKAIAESTAVALGVPPEAPSLPAEPAVQQHAESGDGGATAPDKLEPAKPQPDEREDEDEDEIRFGDDVAAINPAVTGRAFQIQPLAVCS